MSIGIGDALRDARRRRGCSLADASEETRVRETYLAALEQEEFAALGGDVYVKGFITSYAKYLKLDPEPLLAAYRDHASDRDGAQHRPSPAQGGSRPTPFEARRERPAGVVVLVVLVMLIVVALIAISLRGGEETAALGAEGLRSASAASAGTEPERSGPLVGTSLVRALHG